MAADLEFGFYRYDDFIALPHDPHNWLIHPLIPAGGWINVYGKPKMARKSYWALGASWAISTGQDRWLGFEVRKSGPVLYFQADTPHGFWRQRTMDMASGGYDLSNIWFASMITMPSPFNILDSEDILRDMICRAVDEADDLPSMVVLDTAREIHTGNENDSQEMTMVRHALDRAIGPEAAKLLISHDKKLGQPAQRYGKDAREPAEDIELSTNIMEGSRGSTALSGKMDTVIRLSSKGCMDFQGRASAYERKMLNFVHVHNEEFPCPHQNERDCMGWIWEEDIPAQVLEARKLIKQFPSGSERYLGRMLAKRFMEEFKTLDSEAARSIIRREKKKS